MDESKKTVLEVRINVEEGLSPSASPIEPPSPKTPTEQSGSSTSSPSNSGTVPPTSGSASPATASDALDKTPQPAPKLSHPPLDTDLDWASEPSEPTPVEIKEAKPAEPTKVDTAKVMSFDDELNKVLLSTMDTEAFFDKPMTPQTITDTVQMMTAIMGHRGRADEVPADPMSSITENTRQAIEFSNQFIESGVRTSNKLDIPAILDKARREADEPVFATTVKSEFKGAFVPMSEFASSPAGQSLNLDLPAQPNKPEQAPESPIFVDESHKHHEFPRTIGDPTSVGNRTHIMPGSDVEDAPVESGTSSRTDPFEELDKLRDEFRRVGTEIEETRKKADEDRPEDPSEFTSTLISGVSSGAGRFASKMVGGGALGGAVGASVTAGVSSAATALAPLAPFIVLAGAAAVAGKALTDMVEDGIEPTLRWYAKFVPALGMMISGMEAVDKRYQRDMATFAPVNPALMSQQVVLDSWKDLNNLRRSEENGNKHGDKLLEDVWGAAVGGPNLMKAVQGADAANVGGFQDRNLRELLTERTDLNFRWNQATSNVESEFSKLIYVATNDLLKTATRILEIIEPFMTGALRYLKLGYEVMVALNTRLNPAIAALTFIEKFMRSRGWLAPGEKFKKGNELKDLISPDLARVFYNKDEQDPKERDKRRGWNNIPLLNDAGKK